METFRVRTSRRKSTRERMPKSDDHASWNRWIMDARERLSSDSPTERLLGVTQLRIANLKKKDIGKALFRLKYLSRDRNFAQVADEAARTLEEAGGCSKDAYMRWLHTIQKKTDHSKQKPKLVVVGGR